jgi:hypothetical protein
MTVKYFHSAMGDAPVLNGVAGSLIGVLDACLVNGFQLKTVDSIVVAANVATVSISAGHTYEVDSVVLIAGATPAGLNGQKRVVSATTNTLTFAAPGISDQTATGTIDARLAPAGWEKPFSGTNLAVYRSPNIEGTRMYLRVDDTGTIDARVVGYENMTDVNTGTGPFPTSVQQSGGLFWPKASTTAATARAWTIIADDRTFWYWAHTRVDTLGGSGFTVGFGDFNSLKSGDAYACFILGATATIGAVTSYTLTTTSTWVQSGVFVNTAGSFVARSFTGVGGSLAVDRVTTWSLGSTGHSGDNNTSHTAYPNGPNNSLIVAPMFVREGTPFIIRGRLRGVTYTPQNAGTAFPWRMKVDGQGEYSNRRLMALPGTSPANTGQTATQFFDITGPW